LTRIGFQSDDSINVKRKAHSKHRIPDLHPFLSLLSSFSGGWGVKETMCVQNLKCLKMPMESNFTFKFIVN